MEQQTLNLILTISSTITAIGTLSAVILSLHLARRDHNINIDISTNITRQVILAEEPIPDENEYLSFSITNVGFRDATITKISWKIGLFNKKYFMQIFDFSDPYITRLPAKLEDGDQANLFVKVDELRQNKDFLEEIYGGPFKRIWFYFFKVLVSTSTGEEFNTRPNQRVRNMFLKLKKEENLV